MDGICNRCLVIVNSTTRIRARYMDQLETFSNPSDMPALLDWVLDKLAGGWRLETDASIGTFRSISIWHGDPVCQVHLFMLVEAEMREGYGARALRPR